MTPPLHGIRHARFTALSRTRRVLQVPIYHLKPIQPSGRGEQVVVIHGDRVGFEGVVQSYSQDEFNLATREAPQTVVCSERRENLCIVPR